MAGDVDNTRGTPVTQAALLASFTGQPNLYLSQAAIGVTYKTSPSIHIGVTQAGILATIRPAASAGVRTTQEAVLAAVKYQTGNIKVRVTQAAVMIAYKTGVPGQTRQRAWTFDFDGHSFYVLDLAEEGTWVYDLTTEQWSKFETQGFGVWNMINGYAWESNRMVVGGDSISTQVYRLDPLSGFDDGWRPAQYRVTAGITSRAKDTQRFDSIRLHVSTGYEQDPLPVITMKFSDDNGATWSGDYPFQLIKTNYSQRIEWNSLGSFGPPGRVFDFSDEGGLIRIDAADAQIDGKV